MAIAFVGEGPGTGTTDTSSPYSALYMYDYNNAAWSSGDLAVGFYWRENSGAVWGSSEAPIRAYGSSTWDGERIYAEAGDATYGSVVAVAGVLTDSRTGTTYNGEILNDHSRTNPVFCGQGFSSGAGFDVAVVGTRVTSPGSSISVGNLDLAAGDMLAVYVAGVGATPTQTSPSISSDSHTLSSLTSRYTKGPATLYWSIISKIRAYQYTATVDSGSAGTGAITVSPGFSSSPARADVIVVRIRQSSGATTHDGSAALTSTTALSSTAIQGWLATASLTAQSNVTATATTSGTAEGAADLTAESSLSATGVAVMSASAALTAQSSMTATAGGMVDASADLSAQSDLTATYQPDLEWFQNRGGGAGSDDITDPYSNEFIWTSNSDTDINRMAQGDLIYAFYGSEEDDPYGDYAGMLRPYGTGSWVGDRWAKTAPASGYSGSVLLLGIAPAANSGANYESEIRGIYGYNRHGYGGHIRSLNGYYDIDTGAHQSTSTTGGSLSLGTMNLQAGDIIVLHFAAHSASVNAGTTLSATGYTFSSETRVNVRGIGQNNVTLAGDAKSDRRVYASQFEVLTGSAGDVTLTASVGLASSANLLDILALRVRKSAVPLPVLDAAGLTFESDLTATADAFKVGSSAMSAETALTSSGVAVILTPISALTAETSMAGTAIQGWLAGAALTAESDSTAAAVRIVPASSALVGNSTGSMVGFAVTGGGTAMSAQSVLTATGFVITEADSALTAESDATATGVAVILTPTSAMSAESAVTASAIQVQPAAVTLTAQSDLAATGDYIAMGTAALVGGSESSLTAVAVRPGDVALVASSALTADGFVILGSTADLAGDLTVTVSGVMLSADADLTATSALSADATHVNLAASDLSGTATLSVSGVTLLATASMDSTVTVAASGVAARFAGSALTVQSALDADGWVTFGSTIGISSQSNMEGTAVRVRPGGATLTVQSSLTATAKKVTRATVTMTAQGTLTAQGGTRAFATAALTATLTVAARGGPILDGGTATLSAESVIAPVDYQYFVGVPLASVSLSVQSSLTATPNPIYRLRLPTVGRTYTSDRLWKRYPIATAACLIIKDGVATVKDYPNDLELKQADYFWLGGYNYALVPETRQVIIDAGYGDLIEED